VIHNRNSTKLHRELLMALESARTRLAVAIASETKSTPPDRLQYYFDTADQARRFNKKLRRLNINSVKTHQDWSHALENLRRIPAQGNASGLCRMLLDIVDRLE
jgi:hypothetical protein